jgi:hypothetical protein
LLSTGLSKIDDIVVTGSVITGIEEQENSGLFNIYPNPSNGNFSIENDGNLSRITVYDLAGKCIYATEGVIMEKAELSGFNPGMYIVRIKTNDDKTFTRKIVVE